MAISRKLQELLQEAKVKYTSVKHPVAYTAQELAAAQHVPGRQVAKSVLVKTSRGNVLAVPPAIQLIDFKKLKVLVGGGSISIAKESDIKTQFPDVEVGAMSPFGNLYGVTVIVDSGLSASDDIVFNAGSHTETIKMRYQDFARLVKPKMGTFGLPVQGPKKAAKRTASKKKPARAKKPAKRAARAKSKTKRR